MQHVVVATDLNAGCEALIERAAMISQNTGAYLRLVHVLSELLPPILVERRRRDAQRRLLGWAQHLRRLTGQHVSYNVTHGDAAGRIVREAEDLNAVLTVMGHRRKKRLPRLSRPTALRSLDETRSACLIARGGPRVTPYQTVLIALDDDTTRERLTPYVRYLCPAASLHAFDMPRPPVFPAARKSAEAQLVAMRRALDADLLVLGMPWDDSPNPFRFRRLLKGMVRASECDTLIVPGDCAVIPPETVAAERLRAAS